MIQRCPAHTLSPGGFDLLYTHLRLSDESCCRSTPVLPFIFSTMPCQGPLHMAGSPQHYVCLCHRRLSMTTSMRWFASYHGTMYVHVHTAKASSCMCTQDVLNDYPESVEYDENLLKTLSSSHRNLLSAIHLRRGEKHILLATITEARARMQALTVGSSTYKEAADL